MTPAIKRYRMMTLFIMLSSLFSVTVYGDVLANKPLYLQSDNAIEPNVMLTIDDSGSMTYDYLSSNNTEPSGYKAMSAAYNKLYYNPLVTYKPWINSDGTEYPDPTDTCVRSGRSGSYSYNCTYYTASGTAVNIYSGVTSYTGGPNRTDCANKPTCTFTEEQKNFLTSGMPMFSLTVVRKLIWLCFCIA